MAKAKRLLDLVVEWETRRQRGEAVSAEQLCPDDPALQPLLTFARAAMREARDRPQPG